MNNKYKLLFFCSKLGGGGAEKHLVRVLNYCNFEQYDIHLALTREGGSYENLLDSKVKVHYLTKGIRSSTWSLFRSALPLKRLIQEVEPEAVIGIMDRQNVLLAGLKSQSKHFPPIIICCQNAPTKSLDNQGPLGVLFKKLIPTLYNHADQVIAICQGVKNDLIENFGVKVPVDVIYNAGFEQDIYQKMQQGSDLVVAPIQLVACGRLTEQKGFDILIDAIANIQINEDFKLWILGTGPDEQKLKKQVSENGLSEKIIFTGFVDNPYSYFKEADIFLLSSRWEGFGNVITEAMACGTAVVATNCDFGPNEIITHEENGLLVPTNNPEKLARAIETLMYNENLRNKFAELGKTRALNFDAQSISNEYFQCIGNVIGT